MTIMLATPRHPLTRAVLVAVAWLAAVAGGELGSVVGRTLVPTAISVWLRPSLRIRAR